MGQVHSDNATRKGKVAYALVDSMGRCGGCSSPYLAQLSKLCPRQGCWSTSVNRLHCRALLTLVAFSIAFSAPASHAVEFGQPLGQLYLSFDASERVESQRISAFRSFRVYLLAEVDYGQLGNSGQNFVNGISSWEARIQLPAELLVLERVTPGSCCEVGCSKRGTPDNWFVSLCNEATAAFSPVVLVEYLCLLTDLQTEGLKIGIAPAQPSSFADLGPRQPMPGWRERLPSGFCGQQRCLRPFMDGWQNAGVVINPARVGVEASSFSALKSRY